MRRQVGTKRWSSLLAALMLALLVGCSSEKTASAQTSGSAEEQTEEQTEEAAKEAGEKAGEAKAKETAEDEKGEDEKGEDEKGEDEKAEQAEEAEEAEEQAPTRSLKERAMDPTVPLPEEIEEALSGIDFDPHPEKLTRDSHYWVSNEHFHHLFKPDIKDNGGIWLGVGTDQNYLMAGWAKSPILLMMDFDEQIRNVHHIYGVLFEKIDSPEEFVGVWAAEHEEKVLGWLEEAYEDNPERLKELKKTYDWSHKTIFWRLRSERKDYLERDVPTFVTDQEQYDFIKMLWENDRVFPIRGDLTGGEAMVDIAEALKSVGLELGLMYPSNAEQYFDFTPTYRRNIVVQPWGDTSWVLRTRRMSALGIHEGAKYHYNLQRGENFAGWMEHNRVKKSSHLLLWYKSDDPEVKGRSYIKKEPAKSDPAPEVAEK